MTKRNIVFVLSSLGLFLVASFVPCFLTADAPAYDGSQTAGFPFNFYSWGGLCPDGVCTSFSLLYLFIDLALTFMVIYGVRFVIEKKYFSTPTRSVAE